MIILENMGTNIKNQKLLSQGHTLYPMGAQYLCYISTQVLASLVN
jgi:hypothetical protein